MEELKKKQNESKEEFIARVYDSKVKNNLKNEDCARIINEEFGTNWRESYCRGIAKNFKKGYESALKSQSVQFDNTVMIINDLHCPFERSDVLDIIKKHAHEITKLVIAGDLADCSAISSFKHIKNETLLDELNYTYEFMKKVRAILNNGQEIIIFNGNHEERLRTLICKMHEKDLQKFINPNILEMLVDGYTIYEDNKKKQIKGIEGITVVPHWYIQLDRMVICHPKDFSRVKGKMLESVTEYFVNKGFDFDLVVFGHTHKFSCGIIDRRSNKIALENFCMCKPQDYADCGKLGYTNQAYGYSIIKYNNDEKINFNNIEYYNLDEEEDTTAQYKL